MRRTSNRQKCCRHFRGIQHATCQAGVNYIDLHRQHAPDYVSPCFGDGSCCPQYSPNTPEEMAEQDAAYDQAVARIKQGLSPCCGAEIDDSNVAESGRRKGHGPRYCSRCKKVAFIV
jgi:hypothetical protein